MTAKSDILTNVRRAGVPATERPTLDRAWTTYADRRAQFAQVLESVGGRAVFVGGISDVEADLRVQATYQTASRVCDTLTPRGLGNVDLGTIADPHELADIDLAIVRGELAVAENAAVWVDDKNVRHRAVLFLTQHLALVVRQADLLDNLHQAYDCLNFDAAGYGVFISGPSKTADIEQSLVIGAHGPRSLVVYLTEE